MRVPREPTAPEGLDLLDGGQQAYPRMLAAIACARRSVHMETYGFSLDGIGALFVDALTQAQRRGVGVRVIIDGWGSVRDGRAVATKLREAGCDVVLYNRMRTVFIGRFGRNHRKLLLVDDAVAFLGGINIGDENLGVVGRLGWADLALEIRGPQCAVLGQRIRGEAYTPAYTALRIHLCGIGGGWRLSRRYSAAFSAATSRIDIAHGYFLPDLRVIAAITAAARRGVQVRLLLAGRSDVPFARAATRSLHRLLLASGVSIHEWNDSVLHAKVASVDGHRLLVGSFNLDPLSLANHETLVEVVDVRVVAQGEAWIRRHFDNARSVTAVESGSRLHRWILDPLGFVAARVEDLIGRVLASQRHRVQRVITPIYKEQTE